MQDKEPTQAQLDLEEEFSLDLLLEESMAMAKKRKAVSRKKERHSNDLLPFIPVEGECWKPQFSCAFFIQEECVCGAIHHRFSHYAQFQKFSGKCSGKPTRWEKLKEKPEFLSKPRVLRKCTPICSSCYSLDEAIVFCNEGPYPQLSLFPNKEK